VPALRPITPPTYRVARPSAPELIDTPRLALRRPHLRDAIFTRYSSDPVVTRLVGWPMHRSVDEARAFVAYSERAVCLAAIVGVARAAGVRRLYALCYHSHRASARVLETCDFAREGVLRGYAEFPNLPPVEPQDVLCYAILL
jgi:RimJ/RimL family protein N-acetyltransferase